LWTELGAHTRAAVDDTKQAAESSARVWYAHFEAAACAARDIASYAASRIRSPPTTSTNHFARVLDAVVLDAANQLIDVKMSVAVCIADHKRVCKAAEAERENVREWERRAYLAVAANQPALIREARDRAREHEELASTFETRARELKRQNDSLKQQLRAMNEAIEQAKRAKNKLLATTAARDAALRIERGVRAAREVVVLLEGMSGIDPEDDKTSAAR
jgi:hypothetical protein